MKNEGNFSERTKKPFHDVTEQPKGTTPKEAAMMQSDSASSPRKRELKRDDGLPPAAGEYEPFVTDESVPPSNPATLSVIRKKSNEDPHEPDSSSSAPPDTEPN